MKDYGQVLELSEITLDDCINLYKVGKRILLEEGE